MYLELVLVGVEGQGGLRFLSLLSMTHVPGTGSGRCVEAELPPPSGSLGSSASSP